MSFPVYLTLHPFISKPNGQGSGGQLYHVELAGERIVAAAKSPEFAACRALLARGFDPKAPVRFVRAGRDTWDSQVSSLAWGASRTVDENPSPRFRSYREWQTTWEGQRYSDETEGAR